MENEHIFRRVRAARKVLARMDEVRKNEILNAIADEINVCNAELLAANAVDLSRMDSSNPMYDRLMLTDERFQGIASDMRKVAELPSPLGRILRTDIRPNGMILKRVSVPFGVIGVIYEARPNVSFDVFSLCFKSGNACILKGGSDACESNEAIVRLIHRVLEREGVESDVLALLPSSHESTAQLLEAVGLVDLVIPRGSRRLIDFVRQTAKVPVIETGAGVVNMYFDVSGDKEIGRRCITNAKTRRVSVCNALDCLLVHHNRLNDLIYLCEDLAIKGVDVYADEECFAALCDTYPQEKLHHADKTSFGVEFLSMRIALRMVNSLEEALEHIERYGSGHSESIIAEDDAAVECFKQDVDAACVYVNLPTSFTDGGEFGLGAEIGISTQKLGARGPMGLEELTTYKWIAEGSGQIRQ